MKLYTQFIEEKDHQPVRHGAQSVPFTPPTQFVWSGMGGSSQDEVVGQVVGMELGTTGWFITWLVPDDYEPRP